MRTTKRRISASTPRGWDRRAWVHVQATSCRCHRSKVSGVTIVATWRKACRPNRNARDGEASSVVICQTQASPTQLRSQDAILFNQVRECLALLTIQPADQDCEPHLESRHVDHDASLCHETKNRLITAVDRLVGQFGLSQPRFAEQRGGRRWFCVGLANL